MSALVFRHTHRVSYADCTVGNHVYYGRYLDFLEVARGEFFRALGLTFLAWQQQDVAFPVVECRLRYKLPARYDDLLTIEVWPAMAEGARLNFGFLISNESGRPIIEGETWHVCTSLEEKPRRLPRELIEKLVPYLRKTNP